ncbi:MAG TPA: Ig-like domain-containing protein [Pyrinomonadaceae bacterium]|nr:Ig-like domain-containing protein [Pyrinomonadaceae bacterium]
MPRMPYPRFRAGALVCVCVILAAVGLAVPGLWNVAGQTSLAEPTVLPGDATNVPAAGSQEQPQVARGADAHLAVWTDVRTVLDTESRPGTVSIDNPVAGIGLGSLIDIYAARIDAAGRVVDTTPIVVSQAEFGQIYPRVAWNGRNWLVTWFTKRPRDQYSHAYDIVAARVSPAGQVLDPEPILIASDLQSGHWPETVITDAAGNWVVVWTDFLPQEGTSIPRGVFVARVADDGTVLDPGGWLAYNHHSQYLSLPDLARAGDLYMLTFEGYVGSVQASWAMPLDASFNPLRPGPERIGPGSRPRVASNGDTFFAVFNGQTGTRISRAGDPLDPLGIQISTAGGQDAGQVTWDGANWLVSHNVGTSNGDNIAVTRVSPAGQVLGSTTLDAGAGHQTYSAVAPLAGGGAQVVWHDAAAGDINAARVSAAGAASPEVTVSRGAPRQSEPRMASNGNGFLAVFNSQTSGVHRVMGQHLDAAGAAVDQEPFVIAEGGTANSPSVAWNGSAYLVVWEARTATGTKQTFARAVPSSGPPPAPAFFVMNGETPDVAGLDGTFLVVNILQETSQIRTTRAVRVSGAGAVMESPFNLDRVFNFAPRAAAFGGRWLVVWERHNNHDDAPGMILGSFVSPADGTFTKPFVAGDTAGNDKSPHLAVAGEHALLAWHYGDTVGRSGDINTRRLNPDGTSPEPNAGTPLVTAADVQAMASVAWDGGQYVVTWVDHRNAPFPRQATGDVYAARVSATNVRLEEFPVANSALPEDTPFVVSANGLTLFSYAKFYPEAPFAAHRLTLRAARFAPPDLGAAPAAPSSLVAQQVNTGPAYGSVRLAWRDNSTDEAGFRVELSTNGTSFSQIRQLPAGTTAAQDITAGSQSQNYFRVRAYNAAGDSAYTNIASPPVATLVSPPSATVYNYPAVVPVAAAASDPDGIARVEFYAALDPAGAPALIATDTTADAQGRYSFDWAAPAGYYHITAKAFDAHGSSTVAYETTVLVRRAPSAAVTAPAEGATFAAGSAVTLTASAQTANGRSDEYIQRLDFYAGDVWVGQGTSTTAQGPWSFTWQNAPAGAHSVTAHATSNWGLVGVSAPVRINVGTQPPADTNAKPAVTLTAPANNSSVAAGARVGVAATASDTDGQIARVEFRANGFLVESDTAAPYGAELSLPGGTHTITAVAVDDQGGATTSAAAAVTVARAAGAQLVSSVGDGRSVLEPSVRSRAGAPMNKEMADDFDLAGDIDRVVVHGTRGFNAPDSPAIRGAYVRFYAWAAGVPGALQEEMFLPAGDPGLVYDARTATVFDLRLPRSFRATGKHFFSVQLVVEGTSGYWYWLSARTGAPLNSPVKVRDAYAGNSWVAVPGATGPANCDAVFSLYGTARGVPVVASVSPASAPRSGYLRIEGSNFGATQNGGRVTVGGLSAVVARWTDAQIIAYVPEGAALGTAAVQVTTAAGAGGSSINVTARPSDGRVRWRFTMAADYTLHRAAVGPDGTVYVNDVAGRLYALTPSGGLKWIFQAGIGGSVGPVTVGPDGTVYVGGWTTRDPAQTCSFDPVNVHGIFAVNPDGTQKWLFNRTCDTLVAGPNVGPDGRIYGVTDVGGLGAFALKPDGAVAWQDGRWGTDTGNLGAELSFGPAAPGQPPTQFYFQNNPTTGPQDTIKGYTIDGRKVFEQATNIEGQPVAGPLAGNVFTVTFPTGVGTRLRSYTPQGTLRWQSPISPVSGMSAPDAAPDETVYVTVDGGVLYAVDPATGAARWKYDDPYVVNAPVVSPDNRVVLLGGRLGYGQAGFFAGVGTDGRLLWRQNLPDEPGFAEYGQVAPSSRARFTADGQTAYIAADVLGDNSRNGSALYSYFYALDTSAADVPVNQPPRVTMTSPVAGSKVARGTQVTISADVSDDGAISGVDFYVNTQLVATDTAAPYSTTYTPTTPATYSIRVVARDAGKLQGEATSSFYVPNELPRPTWVSPADGASFPQGATVTLKAKATDLDGTVTKVDFYSSALGLVGSDTTPDAAGDYSVDFVNPASGTHTLTAWASDNDGDRGASSITITVASAATPTPTPTPTPNPTAPAVKITNPAGGGTYPAGTTVQFTAEATASAGRTVARVEFVWVGAQVLCTDFNAPYNCTLSSHGTDLYEIVAVAYDSAGVSAKSSPVHVIFEDSRRVSISGSIRHNASQPGNEIFLTNALVKLELDNRPYRETRTDAQGNFRFDNLGYGGAFTLRPAEPGYTFYPPYVSWSGIVEDSIKDFVADGPVPPQPQPQPTPGANVLAWEKFYDGPRGQSDSASRLFVDAQGNSYVAGVTTGATGAGDTDIVTAKYDPAGALLWAKTFAGPGAGQDQPAALRVDAGGNVYVAGYAHRGATYWQDFVTLKYDAAGNERWVRYYNGPKGETDMARSLELDAAGNVYVTGCVTSAEPATGRVFEEFATVKYDPAGAEQWVRLHSTKQYLQNHYAVDIAVDADGNSYVTGYGVLDTGYDVVTVKYSPAGQVLWTSRFNGEATAAADVPVGVLLDPSGHLYVYGYSNAGRTREDFLLVKLNGATGATLWGRTWAAPAQDYARDAAVDAAGNVVLTGETRDAEYFAATNNATTDVATVKFDAAGNLIWERVYRAFPGKADVGRSVALDAAGAAYVGAYSEGFFNSDTAVIKYGADGTEAWVYRYDNPAHTTDQLSGLRADGAGNLYLAGSATIRNAAGAESLDISLVKLAVASSAAPNSPPEVSLSVAPSAAALASNTTTVNGCSVTLTAAAADRDGTVAVVDFYNGATRVGTDTAAPYSFSWTPQAGGTFAVTAMATDNTGATRTSATSAVTLTCSPAPTPTPTPAPTYAVGGRVTAGGAALAGVTVTLSGTRSATATTGADGRYSFTNLPAGANCTVTPSLKGYEFTPASKSFASVSADQTADFTAATASRVNVALAANGATATASSLYDTKRLPVGVINGDRKGLQWGTGDPNTGSGWTDGTSNAYPDWVEVAFAGARTIDEIDVFTLQDNHPAPAEPTEALTFSKYGVTAFRVEYWTGTAWAAVPGAAVTGNNRVWRRFAFAPLTTAKIRVVVSGALAGSSRLTEVEAWAGPAAAPPPASPLVNHALASNGALATASSTFDAKRLPIGVINGDRKGLQWGTGDPNTGSGWTDGTSNAFPDWVEVQFPGPRPVQEVSVFTLQDNYPVPVEPTEALTFTKYGVTDFQVEYWTGSAWQMVPGGLVVSNNKVWSRLTFEPLVTTKLRVVVNSGLAGNSRLTEVEAWGAATGATRVNVAAAANGATAAATSVFDQTRLPIGAINGDRKGVQWGAGDPATGSGWTDGTNNAFPDRLEITFSGTKSISEVSVFTLQDNHPAPVEPTEALTFTKFGVQDFDVEYWTGSTWQIVPGGMVTGNNKVWRKLTFPPLSTTKIRVSVKKAMAGYSRITEVEAY